MKDSVKFQCECDVASRNLPELGLRLCDTLVTLPMLRARPICKLLRLFRPSERMLKARGGCGVCGRGGGLSNSLRWGERTNLGVMIFLPLL